MCKMTRQHFQFIAEVIAQLDDHDELFREQVATLFANALKRTNPRFNRERFLKVCLEPSLDYIPDLTGNNNKLVECFDPLLRPDKYDGVRADTHSL